MGDPGGAQDRVRAMTTAMCHHPAALQFIQFMPANSTWETHWGYVESTTLVRLIRVHEEECGVKFHFPPGFKSSRIVGSELPTRTYSVPPLIRQSSPPQPLRTAHLSTHLHLPIHPSTLIHAEHK